MISGLLNINKPTGPTSHDIVAGTRRYTGVKRVGHAGTLDPMAEGVLVLGLGKATRLLEYAAGSHKQYRATITLGYSTDTYDVLGSTVYAGAVPALTTDNLEAILGRFVGDIYQKPPPYSAIKVRGKSAYALMRAGTAVSLEPRPIKVFSIELRDFAPPQLELDLSCSSGTYVRSLAHDLGTAIGCGAVLSRLTRLSSGGFSLSSSVAWSELCHAFNTGTWQVHLLPIDLAVVDLPAVELTYEMTVDLAHGRSITTASVAAGLHRAVAPNNALVGLVAGDPLESCWRPEKVLISPQELIDQLRP